MLLEICICEGGNGLCLAQMQEVPQSAGGAGSSLVHQTLVAVWAFSTVKSKAFTLPKELWNEGNRERLFLNSYIPVSSSSSFLNISNWAILNYWGLADALLPTPFHTAASNSSLTGPAAHQGSLPFCWMVLPWHVLPCALCLWIFLG